MGGERVATVDVRAGPSREPETRASRAPASRALPSSLASLSLSLESLDESNSRSLPKPRAEVGGDLSRAEVSGERLPSREVGREAVATAAVGRAATAVREPGGDPLLTVVVRAVVVVAQPALARAPVDVVSGMALVVRTAVGELLAVGRTAAVVRAAVAGAATAAVDVRAVAAAVVRAAAAVVAVDGVPPEQLVAGRLALAGRAAVLTVAGRAAVAVVAAGREAVAVVATAAAGRAAVAVVGRQALAVAVAGREATAVAAGRAATATTRWESAMDGAQTLCIL